MKEGFSGFTDLGKILMKIEKDDSRKASFTNDELRKIFYF
jgi:hypothetical protein